jgi:hypothetical protein
MPAGSAVIEHLARVFLAGFQMPADMPAEEVWRYVAADLQRLAATLPPDEAAALAQSVRALIDARQSSA